MAYTENKLPAGLDAKTTPIDADVVVVGDSADTNRAKKTTWANIKATLKTYFDTVYNNYTHPNHTGDVTSTGDGATAIANSAVTNAKMADMNASTIKGRITTTGAPQDLTATQVRTLLNVADGADATNATNVSDAGAIMKSLVDAKGDIVVGTANDTVARLPVGTNGQVLSADSAESGGLKWIAVTGTGTVTSVAASVPTGLTVSGSPVTTSGTLAIALDTGYVIPTQTTLDAKMEKTSSSVASSSTPTPQTGADKNTFFVTALAANATFGAPSGTPTNGSTLVIRVKDNGTRRTLGWNAIYRGDMPTDTIDGTLYIGFMYNSADSKWDCLTHAEIT